MNAALYIHVPFCRRRCFYCDFYSVPYRYDLALAYVGALCRQIKERSERFTSVYVGGGTPTVLPVGLLARLLSALAGRLADDYEFTLEANPESLTPERLRIMRDHRVNRLSVGVQSFNDAKLRQLGRVHDAAAARAAITRAERFGFDNLGLDLIFGAAGETIGDWRGELAEAVVLPVKHISAYALSCEKSTPLYRRLKQGQAVTVSERSAAAMYRLTMRYLPSQGFAHYEVSNYARSGFACRHNQAYWDNDDYLGLGASAVSGIAGVRVKNVADIEKYIFRVGRGLSVGGRGERLSVRRRAGETAAVKVRTAEGVGKDWFKEKTGFDFFSLYAEVLPGLVRHGLLKYIGPHRVALTRRGFLFADEVSRALL